MFQKNVFLLIPLFRVTELGSCRY